MSQRIILACLGLLLFCGCVPEVSTENTSEAMKNDLALDQQVAAQVYTGKAYLIGTIEGALTDALAASISFTQYDGQATDGPIFVSGNAFDGLTDTQKAGILAAFRARIPILLVNAGADTVNSLIDLLHGDQHDFVLPPGATYVELFAVDTEADGDVYHWAMYPPAATTEDPDGAGDRQARVNILVAWLQANGQRDEVEESARLAASASMEKAAAGSQELTSLASAFVKQDNFTDYGNNYQISHYVYGCHSMTTGDDWIYVQQRCLFYAGGAYKGKIEWYKGAAGAVAYWYLDNINLDTTLRGYDNNPAAVGLQLSNPETANNVAQVTSGVSWNIGGEVSVGKDGPAAKISGGVTISNSTTVNVQDCEVVNKSASRNNNAAWTFTFKKCDSIAYIGYAGVTDPPKLATTTFQPFNQWIWRVSPSVRAAKPPMHIKFNVGLVGTTGMWDFMWVAHPWQQPRDGGSWEYDVPFDYPPIAQ